MSSERNIEDLTWWEYAKLELLEQLRHPPEGSAPLAVRVVHALLWLAVMPLLWPALMVMFGAVFMLMYIMMGAVLLLLPVVVLLGIQKPTTESFRVTVDRDRAPQIKDALRQSGVKVES